MHARINCPLCDWHYDVPELDPRIDSNTLAGVFGHGIMANIAINRRNEETERKLNEHLSTHKLVEWAKKVSALETELRLMRAAFL
jgi:hypothetical protein